LSSRSRSRGRARRAGSGDRLAVSHAQIV